MEEKDWQQQQKVLKKLKKYIDKFTVKPEAVAEMYHYTTIEALFNGILVKEATPQKEICLRASDARYMNDPTEMKVGFDFLESFDGKTIGVKEILSSFYEGFSQSYLTSFSLRRDSLMMWHMYSNNATGISLCFDVDKMQEDSKDSMLRCIYYTKEMSEQIEAYLKELNIKKETEDITLGMIVLFLYSLLMDKGKTFEKIFPNMEDFLMFVLSLKSPAYKDEQEIRLLMMPEEMDEESTVKYQLRNNLIVPYIEYYMSKDSLREIIVGPNNDMPRTIISIQDYLDHLGLDHIKVSPSAVPYRGC